jgi:hypothetical protein
MVPLFIFTTQDILKTVLYLTVARDVCKEYGTYDANRAMQNGYNPFPFRPVKKTE